MNMKITQSKENQRNVTIFLSFSLFLTYNSKGVDIRYDGGLSLALAFWSRSAVLLDLNRGADALVDIQCAIDNGLDELKKQCEYYARLAKANASKCLTI